MITNVDLFQFKRFKDGRTVLSSLTLLTGINGMGKSSVIQSLLILRQSFDRGDLQNNSTLVIEDEIINLISPDDMLYSGASSKTVTLSVKDDKNSKATWSVNAEGESNSLPYTYTEQNGNIYECSLFDEHFQYLNAERIGPRPTYDRLRTKRKHSPIGYRGEFAANRILEALTKVEEVRFANLVIGNRSAKVYDQLSAWVSEIIYPGTKVEIDGSDSSKIVVNYSFADEQSKTFNPVNVGFGFSFALPVILAALTAPKGSLLIVENPEAHLHPKGQLRIGKLLALAAHNGVQVIVETHSDHLLNGIRLAVKENAISKDEVKLAFFSANGNNIDEQPSIDSDGRITNWPQDFFDTWEYSLMELL